MKEQLSLPKFAVKGDNPLGGMGGKWKMINPLILWKVYIDEFLVIAIFE